MPTEKIADNGRQEYIILSDIFLILNRKTFNGVFFRRKKKFLLLHISRLVMIIDNIAI